VRAWDTEGNPSAEVDVTLIYRAPDTVPPVIQPEAATQATVGVPISLSVAASDGEGIVSVTVFYKGPRDGSFKAVRMNFSDGKYTAPVPALTEPGEVQYFFLARDLAGNEARSPAVGTLSVTMEPAGKAANSVEFEAVSVAAAMAASVAALLLWRGKVR
jgi:hypothetical protein